MIAAQDTQQRLAPGPLAPAALARMLMEPVVTVGSKDYPASMADDP